jgi:hypothetical protein
MNVPLLKEFDKILFVDNGIVEPNRLFDTYLAAVGEEFAKQKADHVSAVDRDAFEGFLPANSRGDISASNFRYKPEDVGKDEHDKSIVMQYALGDSRKVVVDFDDSSTKLITHWLDAGNKASVMVYPHHGSRENNIDEVLEKRDSIGLQDIIITVNRTNRYLHPAPEVFLKLLSELKPEHVFVTDSWLGENVTVGLTGVTDGRSTEAHIQRLRDFVAARIFMHTAAVRELVRNPFSDEAGDDAESLTPAKLDTQVETAIERSKLKVRPANKVRRHILALRDYRKAMALLGAPQRDESIWIAGLFRGGELDPPPGAPVVSDDPKDSPGGAGGYMENARENGALRESASKVVDASPAFEAEEKRAKPTWGGIVFGNKVTGPRPEGLSFDEEGPRSAVGRAALSIHLRTHDGEGDYLDVTREELWAAYNFVSPSASLKQRFGTDVRGNMGGIVGLDLLKSPAATDPPSLRTVALHPALANTQMGWDAMYADQSLIAVRHIDDISQRPAVFANVKWERFTSSYWVQWFDAPSQVQLRDGLAQVVPVSGPSSCLLRVRVANENPHAEDDAVDAYEQKRIDERAASRGMLAKQGGAHKHLSIADAEERGIASFADIMDWDVEARANFRKFGSSWKSVTVPVDEIRTICEGYPPMVEMDRLARLIALLNWYSGFGSRALPPVPSDVKPIWRSTPNVWDGDNLRRGGPSIAAH